MKRIEIREKIAPFSHLPGTQCIVPLSDWIVTVFPALLRISESIAIPIHITGPVSQFLVQMDLERDCVWISGVAREGYYRLKLSAFEEGLALIVDRSPKEGILINSQRLKAKDKILIASGGKTVPQRPVERISLGNWKAQDWDLVRRRTDPREFVPALYLLGQKTPAGTAKGGTAALLAKSELRSFFLTALSGLLVPHLTDVLHQGIAPEEQGSGDPLALLSMTYQKIRSFLIEEESQIHILPRLPNEWVAGRATGLQVRFGRIDLEWTKGSIRRLIIHSHEEASVAFAFSKSVGSFRCDGKRIANGEFLFLKPGITLLDRFQK